MFRLKQLRKQKGMLLKELSQEIGIPTSTYAGYEREEREPKLEVWIKMAKYFDVDVAYLQGVSDIKKALSLASIAELSLTKLYCPYCGAEEDDAWEFSDYEGTIECGECENEYHYSINYEPVYTVKKLEEM